MYHFEDSKPRARPDSTEQHRLLLDGTANLDYADDDDPQILGLIALLKQYFGVNKD